MVIDENVVKRNVVWFVDEFVDVEMVENGEVESIEVVIKIFVRIECLVLVYINWIDNISIDEDLDYV